MENLFFDSWEGLLRTTIMTILAYFTMIIILRISGKRTLSKMNAFDFIVTVALGSSLATVALSADMPLAKGILVFFLLIFLQYVLTWLSVRVKKLKRVMTSQPSLLLYKGKLLKDVLKEERITLEEIYVVLREKGINSLEEVDIIVLETTGELTVIPSLEISRAESLQDVRNVPHMAKQQN